MNAAKWEAHTGADYTVVMLPGEATDAASIQVFGDDAPKIAALIAAAPALKAFADEFAEACSIKAAQGSKAVLGITELNRLWEMARAAIATADA